MKFHSITYAKKYGLVGVYSWFAFFSFVIYQKTVSVATWSPCFPLTGSQKKSPALVVDANYALVVDAHYAQLHPRRKLRAERCSAPPALLRPEVGIQDRKSGFRAGSCTSSYRGSLREATVGTVEEAVVLRPGLQMEAAPDPGPGLCCKPGGRLDMSHGFVHHIRRNQIARDDYDKKVKQAAKEKARRRHTPAPTRPRKPDQQVYLPRHRDASTHPANPDCEESGDSSSSGSSELEPSGRQLFCLEYEADSGEVTSVIVYQDDDPGKVSEEVSAHTPLDPPMREALKFRIQEEIAKRQSQH